MFNWESFEITEKEFFGSGFRIDKKENRKNMPHKHQSEKYDREGSVGK